MAIIYGFWSRYEPRPADAQIDEDLVDFCLWVAEISDGLDPANVAQVFKYAGHPTKWPRQV